MCNLTDNYLSEIIRKIATENNFNDWRYTVNKFESIAQNYFSIIVPVVISGRQSTKEIEMKLVLKLAPTEERYRVSGAVTAMFVREHFVYNVILWTYQELQELFPAHLRYVIPHCFFAQSEHCHEVLALQDMHADGYKPYIHEMFLDLDHITVSLKSLAKFHALSFIVQNKIPELYSQISQVCVPLTEKSYKRYMDVMRDRLEKAICKFANTVYIPLLESLKDNCGNLFKSAIELAQKTCICHGDIWKENILYKYRDNQPVSACLIDYQTSRIGSPAFDTLYLIMSSTNSDLRHNHYDHLLDVYYQTFDQFLNEAQLKSQEIYSRQMFDRDLKVVGPTCFIVANTAMWLSNGLQEEGHVRSKHTWSTQEEKDMAMDKYKSIIKAMLDDLNLSF